MYHICRSIAYKNNPTGRNTRGLNPVIRLAMLPFHCFTFTFPDDSFHSPLCIFLFFLWCRNQMRALASSFLRFLDYTQWRNTVGRTPLEGRSDIHALEGIRIRNPSKRAVPNPCLDQAATGIGPLHIIWQNILLLLHAARTFNSITDYNITNYSFNINKFKHYWLMYNISLLHICNKFTEKWKTYVYMHYMLYMYTRIVGTYVFEVSASSKLTQRPSQLGIMSRP